MCLPNLDQFAPIVQQSKSEPLNQPKDGELSIQHNAAGNIAGEPSLNQDNSETPTTQKLATITKINRCIFSVHSVQPGEHYTEMV
ncbi:hypothetical protein DdX_17390 [Ditylenchus destructor]|uniref:Uncharacterized protein n=1 Tax=Ditylenchus destructor TaxID=166010 RepID=A0AAD4QZ19_9BILA|nr:hypothetical protein DdX_17390 [Ditylenchus destructor]